MLCALCLFFPCRNPRIRFVFCYESVDRDPFECQNATVVVAALGRFPHQSGSATAVMVVVVVIMLLLPAFFYEEYTFVCKAHAGVLWVGGGGSKVVVTESYYDLVDHHINFLLLYHCCCSPPHN